MTGKESFKVGLNYLVERKIGSGAYSVVWKGKHVKDDRIVAIKEIDIETLSLKLKDSLLAEISILQSISHPNIIRFYEVVRNGNKAFLILEYCEKGDLASFIRNQKRVSCDAARYLMKQLADGLNVLRSKNLIHRDLKPQNLLLASFDGKVVLKIADFGFARHLKPQGLAETICGSPLYMAPEVMQSHKYDAKADLWSVGCILYELVTGQQPFYAHTQLELLNKIMKSDEITFPTNLKIHPDCTDLCRKLLRKNPVERISSEEFFSHIFIQQGRSLIQPKNTDSQASVLQEGPFKEILEKLPKNMEKMEVVEPVRKEKHANATSAEIIFSNCIEDSYVIVNLHALPTENNSDTQHQSGSTTSHVNRHAVDNDPLQQSPSSKVQRSTNSVTLNRRQHSVSNNILRRLNLLKQYAEGIAELSKDKDPLETFALQGIRLAVWRHALCVGYAGALSVTGEKVWVSRSADIVSICNKLRLHRQKMDSPSKTEAAAASAEVEKHFMEAVKETQKFASKLEHLDGSEIMPDALEIIFCSAIEMGKEGAMKDLFQELDKAAELYSKAATLLSFILFEAPNLDIHPRFTLNHTQHERLSRCVDQLNSKHEEVVRRLSSAR